MAARLILSGLLVAGLLFCGFGFLATFEPLDEGEALRWRVGYGVAGLGNAALLAWLWRPRRRP